MGEPTAREQYLDKCRKNALESLAQEGRQKALARLASELAKHPGTEHFGLPLMPHLIAAGIVPDTEEDVKKFIEGFN